MRRAVYLRSRVGRRVVALFFLSAALPTGLLTLLGYRRIKADLETATESRLFRESKSVGIMVLDRLAGTREIAIELSRDLAPGAPAPDPPTGFRWLAVRAADGTWSRTGSSDAAPPKPGAGDLARIQSGRAWLWASPSAIVVAVRLPRDTMATLFAAIEPERIWGTAGVNELRPDGRSLCIRSADGTMLHQAPAGACTGPETERHLSGLSTAFLGFEFGAPSWQVMLAEPARVALAPIASFESSFVWVALLTLAVIFVLANIQIRRSMTPLDLLTEGTRRLSAGDLSHRVTVTSTDEFRQLADSFNGMAASLDGHVGLLVALQQINQAALASPGRDTVVKATLRAVRQTFSDATAIFAVSPAVPSHPWEAHGMVDGQIIGRFRPGTVALAAVRERGASLDVPVELTADLPAAGDHRAAAVVASDGQPFGFIHLSRATEPFTPADLERLGSLAEQASVALTNSRLVERLDEMSWGSLKALSRTIDANSRWTAGHSERVTAIAVRIGEAMGLSASELDALHRGGLLHDIGKIGVPASILDKPESLSAEERAVVERHPIVGAEILSPLPVFARAVPLVRWHHESLDGTGYPDRLIGDQIPLLVRILTVGDVWDALTSNRPYRPAWPVEDAIRHFKEHIGRRFDPHVVATWIDLVRDEPSVAEAIRLPRSGIERPSVTAR